ncbi:MAG: hypothetical protein AB7I01_13455 [Gammaproteobacteria bacterium]
MSDDDQDFEKTQIYLPPGKGGAGQTHASKPLHEVLLKPQKGSVPAEAPSLDFDITGAAPPAPQDSAAVDFDITGADDVNPVPPPAPRAAKAAAPPPPPAPAPAPGSNLGLVIGALVVLAIIAFLVLR